MLAYIDNEEPKTTYTTGFLFEQKLNLTGFYASVEIPISIDVIFRPKDSAAQIYFRSISVSWKKCYEHIDFDYYLQQTENPYHVKIKIRHLKFDAVFLLSSRVCSLFSILLST